MGRWSLQGRALGGALASCLGLVIQGMGLINGSSSDGANLSKSDFFQSLSLSHFTCTSSQASSQVECGALSMVGMHPRCFEN